MLVSIVFDSGFGHTARQAEAVAAGAGRVEGVEVRVIAVADGSIPWDDLEASDAIIFGSPTYMGTLSARFKQFMEDATKPAWFPQKWRNKIAAGFTNSGAQHGDKLNTLMTMALFAAQHGMIWVGLDLMPGNATTKGSPDDMNRIGAWLGAMAQSNNDQGPDMTPSQSDLKTAAYLGQRVAELAGRFRPDNA
jgi:multimeric flavodoxin WrbA